MDGPTQNRANFEDILSLVVGDVLYKTIATLSESDAETLGGGRMQAVQVYLDTPVVMRLLRYEEDDLRRPIKEMVSLATATGCKLQVFTHTLVEVQNILRGSADTAYSTRQKSPLDERIIAKGISRSDLIEDAQFLPDILHEMDIEVCDPPALTKDLSISERQLDTLLQSRIGYKNPDAKLRDIASLAAIYRLRSGSVRRRIEECEAIFITTNINLAAAATEFFASTFKADGETNVMQHCMTDVIFTMRMWLKVPTKFVDVPRNQLIAHSLSTLRPHDALYEAFLKQLEQLVSSGAISEDARIKARLAALVTPTLMLETKGKVDALNQGSAARIVSDVLAREQAARAQAAENARREERLRAAKQADLVKEAHVSALQDIRTEQEIQNHALQEAQSQINTLRAQNSNREASRNILANSIATRAAKIIKFVGLLVIAALAGLTFLDAFSENQAARFVKSRIGETGSHAALGILSLVLAALAFKGLSYVDIAKRGEKAVYDYILHLSKKHLQL